MLRILAMISGLTGAAVLSQFPEFSQQYLQRLAGKVDQLEIQVAEIDASASELQMTRDEYLADLSLSRAGAQASAKASAAISIFERLSLVLSRMRDTGPFGRLMVAPRAVDVGLVQRTYADYQPAVPLTPVGAGFAALGFFAGWAIWRVLQAACLWPLRRRRSRALNRRTPPPDMSAPPPEDSLDPLPPLIEYYGESRGPLDQMAPNLSLMSTDGHRVEITTSVRPVAIFTFPLIGRPGEAYPEGWDAVNGGENGTVLACSFRDGHEMLLQAGVASVFGLSANTTRESQNAVHRLALPFPLLSDPDLSFAQALDMPCFRFGDDYYYEPAVYVIQAGIVRALMHPLSDPASAAARLAQTLDQARERAAG